jgi:preprotein translocase subunit YajC
VNPLAIGWILLTVGAFYLLLWRPQKRRMTAVRDLQAQLREGDEVMTTSGIYGRIIELRDDELMLEIAPGTNIRMARGAVGSRLADDETE